MIIQIIQLSDNAVTCARFRRIGKELTPLFGIRLALADHAELGSLLTANLPPVTEEVHTILAIPPSRLGLRELSLPLTDRKKLRTILPMELAGEIADDNVELVCDALPLAGNTQLAGWAAVPAISELMRPLTACGIEPEVVTCASLNWYQLAPREHQGLIALVDDTALMVCDQGRPVFCRLSPQLSTAVAPTLTAVELTKGDTVEVVFRLEGPLLPNEERLPLPDQLTDRIASGDLSAEALLSPLATALAYCSGDIFNLRSGSLAWTGKRIQILRQFRTPLILGGIVLVLLFSEAGLRWHQLAQDIHSVNNSITKIYKEAFPTRNKAVDETAELRADIRRLQRDAASSEVLPFLGILAQAKDDQIPEIREVEFDGEHFILKGDARTNAAATALGQKLATHEWIVEQPELTARPDGMTLFMLRGHRGGTTP